MRLPGVTFDRRLATGAVPVQVPGSCEDRNASALADALGRRRHRALNPITSCGRETQMLRQKRTTIETQGPLARFIDLWPAYLHVCVALGARLAADCSVSTRTADRGVWIVRTRMSRVRKASLFVVVMLWRTSACSLAGHIVFEA